jgi:DNA-binding GntR family transcriptional regulator
VPDAPLFDFHQAREVFATFASLHAEATLAAAPQLTEADYAELEAAEAAFATAVRDGRTDDAIDADDRFHQVFVRLCGDPDVRVGIELVLPRVRTLDQWYFGRMSERQDRSASFHDEILAACRAGDAAEASRLVELSFRTGGEDMVAEAQRRERNA